MVERQLPKLYVEGSIPFSRSKATSRISKVPDHRCEGLTMVAGKFLILKKAERPSAFVWIGILALLLLVVGAVLWDANGSAVFTALVSAALAWCF